MKLLNVSLVGVAGLASLALAAACGSDANDNASTSTAGAGAGPTNASSSVSASSSVASTAATTGSGGGATTSSTGAGAGGPALPVETVRFIAMGDGGEGNDTQVAVANAVKAECDKRGGCDFVLYLGDNIYDSGVDSVDDSQFQTKFEQPYANLTLPFYITLGNHDYGAGGAGIDFTRGAYQIDYTDSNLSSGKWTLPDAYYTLGTEGQKAGVDLFSLDTNAIFFNLAAEQKTWMIDKIAASTANWKIAFGHHTYASNGKHGDAGYYEGELINGTGLYLPAPANGEHVGKFVDDVLCGKVDLYICGHDHNRQWLQPQCGVEFIVSGTAAKHTDLEPDQNPQTPTFFEDDVDGGFFLGEIQGNTFTGWFYDEHGTEEYTRSFTKTP